MRISPFSVLDARIYRAFDFENILLESGNRVWQLHFPVSAPLDVALQLLSCIVVDEKLVLSIIFPFLPAPRAHFSSLVLSHLILLFFGCCLLAYVCSQKFLSAQSHSHSVPNKHTEAFISYKRFGLLLWLITD